MSICRKSSRALLSLRESDSEEVEDLSLSARRRSKAAKKKKKKEKKVAKKEKKKEKKVAKKEKKKEKKVAKKEKKKEKKAAKKEKKKEKKVAKREKKAAKKAKKQARIDAMSPEERKRYEKKQKKKQRRKRKRKSFGGKVVKVAKNAGKGLKKAADATMKVVKVIEEFITMIFGCIGDVFEFITVGYTYDFIENVLAFGIGLSAGDIVGFRKHLGCIYSIITCCMVGNICCLVILHLVQRSRKKPSLRRCKRTRCTEVATTQRAGTYNMGFTRRRLCCGCYN